jgi:hypothetical protein
VVDSGTETVALEMCTILCNCDADVMIGTGYMMTVDSSTKHFVYDDGHLGFVVIIFL